MTYTQYSFISRVKFWQFCQWGKQSTSNKIPYSSEKSNR